MVVVISYPFLIRWVDVALEVQAYFPLSSAFVGFPPPDPVVVLSEVRNVRKASCLDPRFGLPFSKAIPAGNRRV